MARLALRLAVVAGLALAVGACSELKRRGYEPEDRDAWQKPGAVIAALAIEPGQRVADIGSGGGYFSFRLAEAVGPEGRVYAVDIDDGLLAYVAEQARRRGLDAIRTVRAEPDDPKLPEPVDLVFVSNTYHHLDDRPEYFGRLRAKLRPGGRVALVEYTGESGFFTGLFGHHSDRELIEREMREAGYALEAAHDFLPRQHFLIFAPASEA